MYACKDAYIHTSPRLEAPPPPPTSAKLRNPLEKGGGELTTPGAYVFLAGPFGVCATLSSNDSEDFAISGIFTDLLEVSRNP